MELPILTTRRNEASLSPVEAMAAAGEMGAAEPAAVLSRQVPDSIPVQT
jgi:hypothetical protein